MRSVIYQAALIEAKKAKYARLKKEAEEKKAQDKNHISKKENA